MLRTAELHALATGKNLVTPVLLIPLRQSGGHMHLLNNLPPTYPGVVSAKRDLSFLRSVWNDALLGAPKIVVKEILKPHPRHEQQVPPVASPAHNVRHRPVAGDVTIVVFGCAKAFV